MALIQAIPAHGASYSIILTNGGRAIRHVEIVSGVGRDPLAAACPFTHNPVMPTHSGTDHSQADAWRVYRRNQ